MIKQDNFLFSKFSNLISFSLIILILGLIIIGETNLVTSEETTDNIYDFTISDNYHLNKKEILDNIWENQRPLLANSMNYNLGIRKDPYILYNIQLWTNNLLKGAFYDKDYETLDEIAELYLIAYDYLEERSDYVYFWPIIDGVPCLRNVTAPLQTPSGKARMWVYHNSDTYNDGYESFGPSVQFLYCISNAIHLFSEISPDKRTDNMNELIRKYSPVVIKDHYARWIYEDNNVFQVKGWGCEHYCTTPNYNHHDFIEKKLNREFGTRNNLSYCNVYSDYDMWLLAGVVEILAANKENPKEVPLTYEQKSEFLSYVKISLELVKNRLSESQLVDFDGNRVEGLNFDLGAWNDHYAYDYAEYTGKSFPTKSDLYASLSYDYTDYKNKFSLEEISQKKNILLLHLDEKKANSISGGKDVKDSSGNNHHGTEEGGVIFGVDGKVNTALKFDGTDDSISLDDNILDGRNKFSIEVWIKPEEKNFDYSAIIADYDVFYFMIGYTGFYKGKLMWRIWNSKREIESVVFSDKSVIEWGKWQHVAISFDGNFVKLYHNGEVVGQSNAHAGKTLYDSFYLTSVGSRGTVDSWFFQGAIDELNVYDYALSDSEIANIYKKDEDISIKCGNNIREGNEECDGSDNSACSSGKCKLDCTCETKSEEIKKEKENQIGWDISHARRFIHLFNTLYENRDITNDNFPDENVMKKLTNQILYKTFNRDFEEPLFTNFMDGTNGWYRVGYHGDGFAYAPYDLSISLITGGYGFWNKYNKDMEKLMTALWNYAQKNSVTDPYLCSCYQNYQRGCCNNEIFNLKNSKELLMFLPVFLEKDSYFIIEPLDNKIFNFNKKDNLGRAYRDIEFKWNKVFGAEYYIFAIDSDYGYAEVKVNSTSRSGKYYGIGNFKWKIKACNNISCSEWSKENNFKIEDSYLDSPNLIYPLDNEIFNFNKKDNLGRAYRDIEFKWNKVFGAEYYVFAIDSDYGYAEVNVNSTSRSGKYYGIGNFKWKVKTCNNLYCSEWIERKFTINPTPVAISSRVVSVAPNYGLPAIFNQYYPDSIISPVTTTFNRIYNLMRRR